MYNLFAGCLAVLIFCIIINEIKKVGDKMSVHPNLNDKKISCSMVDDKVQITITETNGSTVVIKSKQDLEDYKRTNKW
jgi:hypothetical protein